MSDIVFNENMEFRVFLLSIYKKQDNETIQDVIAMMINSNLFDIKTSKKFIKELKNLNYLIDNSLTMIGIQKAKEVELEFKL